jgi:hypothetical protein
MKPFGYVVAGLLVIVAFFVVPWSYNNWMTKTGPGGTYSPTTAVTGSPSITSDKIDSVLCSAKSPVNPKIQWEISVQFSGSISCLTIP